MDIYMRQAWHTDYSNCGGNMTTLNDIFMMMNLNDPFISCQRYSNNSIKHQKTREIVAYSIHLGSAIVILKNRRNVLKAHYFFKEYPTHRLLIRSRTMELDTAINLIKNDLHKKKMPEEIAALRIL
jgi:hypothetical protein